MRPKYKTYLTSGGTGVQAPIPLDHRRNPFSVSIGVILLGAVTVTYTVQYTLDDVQAPGYTPAGGVWFDHTDLTGKTANAIGTLVSPVRAIRVNITSISGGTGIQLQVLSAAVK